MLDSILNLTSNATTTAVTLPQLLLCTAVSLVLGLIGAWIYMYRNSYSKNFVVTLALLPAIVQIIIMLVNGNLGTGVAVMGAFSLIRFRSVPGSAREITSIFLSMAIGLATGMGYVGIAVLFLLIIGVVNLLLLLSPFGNQGSAEKELKITIPETLDYTGLFDDLFAKYTSASQLIQVRLSNMGSLYELQYHITLNNPASEKQFLDEIRCRNGNLNISCGRASSIRTEL